MVSTYILNDTLFRSIVLKLYLLGGVLVYIYIAVNKTSIAKYKISIVKYRPKQDNTIPRVSDSDCVPNRSMPTLPCFWYVGSERNVEVESITQILDDPLLSQSVEGERSAFGNSSATVQEGGGGGGGSAVNAQRAFWVNCSVAKNSRLTGIFFPWHTAIYTRWKVNQ